LAIEPPAAAEAIEEVVVVASAWPTASPEAPLEPALPPPPKPDFVRGTIAALLAVWFAGTLWFSARLLYGFGILAALRREVQPLAVEEFTIALDQVRATLGMGVLPPIVTSRLVGSPLAVGILRPRVVIPQDLLARLDSHQLRDVLVHECAHVLKRDHLVGLMQRLAELMFWPHPLVHLLNRELARAREELCDNYVLRSGDAPGYAKTLLAMAQPNTLFRRAPATLGLMEPRWRLEDRVVGLLDARRTLVTRMNKATLILVGAGFLLTTLVLGGTRLIEAAAAPPEVAAAPVADVTQPSAPVEPITIEKDGVLFELLVPDRTWTIPENRPRRRTSVKLGLRVTNKTERALRLNGYETLAVEIIGPDGKAPPSRRGKETYPRKESDCPLVKPGESVAFSLLDAMLTWQDDKLQFQGIGPPIGGFWHFADDLKPGRYKLRLRYENGRDEFQLGTVPETVLKDVWTGDATPPLVEISLVEPAAMTDRFGDEVNGLRAKISLATQKFLIGEPIEMKYAVKNVSSAEREIWHSGFWPNHLILVRDADGKEPPLTWMGQRYREVFSPGGSRDKNAPVAMPPGGEDAAYEKYDLTKLYELTKPGKYTVEYIYEEKQGGWEGRLPSNMAAFELADVGICPEEDIEKDGVHFVILVPDRSWSIPPPGFQTPVNVGLRIANKSQTPWRFSRFDSLTLEMVGPDGKSLRQGGGRNGTWGKTQADAPLVKPGEYVTFVIDAALLWHGDELRLLGSDGFGGMRLLHDVKPGQYKVRILYHDHKAELEGSWPGPIATPFVEVTVAKPPERKAAQTGKVGAKADGRRGKDPTAERLKALKDDIESFELHLEYVTAESPPAFTSLLVHTGSERGTFRGNAHVVGATILRDDSLKLLEALSREGFLRDARVPDKKLKGEIGFVLRVRNKTYSQYEVFGPDDRRGRLKTLRTVLDSNETVRALLLKMDGGKEGLLETLRSGLVGEARPSGVDRLEFALASTKAEYRRGEPVDLSLTIKNTGEKEFVWAHYKLQDLVGFRMTGPDGKEVNRTLNPVEIEFADRAVTVEPGKAATVKDGLQGINLPKAGTDRYLRHGYYAMEAPGIYRLRIRVTDVTSNELTVKVLGEDKEAPKDDPTDEINDLIRKHAKDGVLTAEAAKTLGLEVAKRLRRPAWFPDGELEAGAPREEKGVWTVIVTLKTKQKAAPGCTVVFRASGLVSADFFRGA
jgi:beta-lactamase regulating signal transducer with metallopeptidase domain